VGNADGNQRGLWQTLAWFAGLLLLTSLVGFILALSAFLVAFIRFRAGRNWVYAIGYAACGIALMCGMAWLLNRDFPPGLLQSVVKLPWPLT
jgi:putative tricarboxylic transport membrane protein